MFCRKIKNYSDYYITDKGDIYSTWKGSIRKIKKQLGKNGYEHVFLSNRDGERTQKTVHRLIAFAFLPPLKDKPIVNHKDGNKKNNNINNLEWCTHSENIKHAYDNGLHLSYDMRGDKNPYSILTKKEVVEIKERLARKERGARLAREFNVSKSTIYAIKWGKSWKHI